MKVFSISFKLHWACCGTCYLLSSKTDDNVGEKTVPSLRGVSISNNPTAFQKSVNNLATLAYATETVDYTSTEDSGILSSRSSKDIGPVHLQIAETN